MPRAAAHVADLLYNFPGFWMRAAVARHAFWFCWMNGLAGFGGSIARSCSEMQFLASGIAGLRSLIVFCISTVAPRIVLHVSIVNKSRFFIVFCNSGVVWMSQWHFVLHFQAGSAHCTGRFTRDWMCYLHCSLHPRGSSAHCTGRFNAYQMEAWMS